MRVCPRCRSVYSTRTAFCGIDGSKLKDQAADPLIGADVGRYTVVDKLGTGSTGCVYKAVHKELETEFALKVLFGDLGANETIVTRFKREAQAASRIRSPHVVSVVDFGATDEGLVYYVMEYSPGRVLQDLLRDTGALGKHRAAKLLVEIAKGLEAAHSLGFIHRDIKPANIVLVVQQGREMAKILDFGIVRVQNDDQDTTKLTRAGLVIGTPAYMSPEQAAGAEITIGADLYSLGVVLFEMLEGARPFKARSVAEMVVKHTDFPPPPLGHHGGLEEIATRLLAKKPEERYESAAAVIAAVEALDLDAPTTAAVASPTAATRDDRAPAPAPSAEPVVNETVAQTDAGQLTTALIPVNRGLMLASVGGLIVAAATVAVAVTKPEFFTRSAPVDVVEVESPPPKPPPPVVKEAPAPTADALRRRLDGVDGLLAGLGDKVPEAKMGELEQTYLGFYKRLGGEPPEAERKKIGEEIDRFTAELKKLSGS